ncbi:MAG: hypothetical protein ABIP79_04070 [Chitinophagaceae bacterium]
MSQQTSKKTTVIKKKDDLKGAVHSFNYIIGTQQIGETYSFGNGTRLVNAANEIQKLGSNVLKIALTAKYTIQNGLPQNKKIKTITDLVQMDTSVRRVLDMPFTDYLFWAYPFTSQHSGLWNDDEPYTEKDKQAEYDEMYDLTVYLLKNYKGTGKTFYLGNWEGDWHLYKDRNILNPPPAKRIQAMADWLNIRQKAVNDAKRNTTTHDVQVYFYIEVNQGILALTGKTCVTNNVLPLLNVPPDFISISSYSIQWKSQDTIRLVLDYLKSKLAPRNDIQGSRIIIGEYGFSRSLKMSSAQQAYLYQQAAVKYMSWGPRFILSWQLYDNSFPKFSKPKEYNLIDRNNKQTPLYKLHNEFLIKAKEYVSDYYQQYNRLPAEQVYTTNAMEILKAIKLN